MIDRIDEELRRSAWEVKAYYKVLQVFNINKRECWMLLALSGYLLSLPDKYPIAAEKRFFESLTGYYKNWGLFRGYVEGLYKAGLIDKVWRFNAKRPAYILTALGIRAITTWYEELQVIKANKAVNRGFEMLLLKELPDLYKTYPKEHQVA